MRALCKPPETALSQPTAVRLGQRKSKYGAVKETVDGITFHSRKEANRYRELKLLEKAGEIYRLQLQPRYRLCPFWPEWKTSTAEPVPEIGHYVADFRYCTTERCICAWGCVVEDVKGMKTPLYRWKKKHVEAQYGIEIREV